jgi:hypothetical protein
VVAGRFTTISVSRETKERLEELRVRVGARSWDQLLGELVRVYVEYSKLQAVLSARRTMCNDLREARASIAGWIRLLLTRLGDPQLLPLAAEYLVPDPQDPGIYVVDRDRCVQRP